MTRRPPVAVVFDLDDTLYAERDYVLSGFRALGRWLGRSEGIGGFADAAWAEFCAGHRGDIFDRALVRLGVPPTATRIAEMVRRYRSHRPQIRLAPDAERWLARAAGRRPLALITDGPTASQSRKVSALALRDHGFRPILLTDRWGLAYRKPHERAYRAVERRLGLSGAELVYVADNAAKDFLAPRRLGWATVQIRRPGALHAGPPATPEFGADRSIDSLDQLDPG